MTAERAAVWAPRARERVELCLRDQRLPLERGDDEWWRSADAVLVHGTEYAFSIDGGEVRPDPRSRWQPEGPHGWSRWVDHDTFAWTDTEFRPPSWPSAIVYELHVGTFTPSGTFDGAIERLDDLVRLGVTHVELLPVAEFPGRRGWGYDGVDLYAVESDYGGPDGLKRFVAGAHDRGLGTILDVVYNHFGPDGNYFSEFGPYLTDRYHTLWGEAVNLDGPGSDEVRRFFIDNAVAWIRDYHLDGLRLDAVHALIDTSAVPFLEQLSQEVDALESELGRSVVLIAESDLGDPRVVRPREQHGYGLDAQWNDEFRHALNVVLTGEQDGINGDFHGPEDLAAAIRDVFVYQGQRSPHRRRHHGRAVEHDLPRWKFVSFLQNHDQTGNRAKGERTSQLLAPEALEVGAALVLLGPNVPMLFAGEEWAASTPFLYFTDHQDAGLAEAVRQGRRKDFESFGWPEEEILDPQDEQTFRASQLDWDERARPPHRRVLEWHERLIGLRRNLPALAAGTWPEVRCGAPGWLTIERNGTLLAANLATEGSLIDVGGGPWGLELASRREVSLDGGNLLLPEMSIAFLTAA